MVLTLNAFFSAVIGATPTLAVAEGEDKLSAVELALAAGVSGTALAFLLGAAVFYSCKGITKKENYEKFFKCR